MKATLKCLQLVLNFAFSKRYSVDLTLNQFFTRLGVCEIAWILQSQEIWILVTWGVPFMLQGN